MLKTLTSLFLACATAVVLLAGCDNETPNPIPGDYAQLRVNDTLYQFSGAFTQRSAAGVTVAITLPQGAGVGAYPTLQLTILGLTPGTYDLNTSPSEGSASIIRGSATGQTYNAISGSFTITEINNQKDGTFRGTFSFTAENDNGDIVTVTAGEMQAAFRN